MSRRQNTLVLSKCGVSTIFRTLTIRFINEEYAGLDMFDDFEIPSISLTHGSLLVRAIPFARNYDIGMCVSRLLLN